MKFPIDALLVLAIFYGIYFAKMLSQKRRGIQTRQLGAEGKNTFARSSC